MTSRRMNRVSRHNYWSYRQANPWVLVDRVFPYTCRATKSQVTAYKTGVGHAPTQNTPHELEKHQMFRYHENRDEREGQPQNLLPCLTPQMLEQNNLRNSGKNNHPIRGNNQNQLCRSRGEAELTGQSKMPYLGF